MINVVVHINPLNRSWNMEFQPADWLISSTHVYLPSQGPSDPSWLDGHLNSAECFSLVTQPPDLSDLICQAIFGLDQWWINDEHLFWIRFWCVDFAPHFIWTLEFLDFWWVTSQFFHQMPPFSFDRSWSRKVSHGVRKSHHWVWSISHCKLHRGYNGIGSIL